MIKTLAFKYTIRRSQRAKKTRIIVAPDKIEVVAPYKVSERKIHAFVESQQQWVVQATEKVEQSHLDTKKLAPKHYEDGVMIPYLGEQIKLMLKSSESVDINIELVDKQIHLNLPVNVEVNMSSEVIRQMLIQWMKQQALKTVEDQVAVHAEKLKLHPRRVRVKAQKSRWGSCGIHNDLNLNWLLILAPPDVLEYVVVHELCHIKERNHSSRFWSLVESHLPDYQKHRAWLKNNGRSLMLGL